MLSFEEKYQLMKLKEQALNIEEFCEWTLDDAESGCEYFATEKFDMEQLEELRVGAHKFVASIIKILLEDKGS